jgi:hypothetical protein
VTLDAEVMINAGKTSAGLSQQDCKHGISGMSRHF